MGHHALRERFEELIALIDRAAEPPAHTRAPCGGYGRPLEDPHRNQIQPLKPPAQGNRQNSQVWSTQPPRERRLRPP
jgi:hypothetical protein